MKRYYTRFAFILMLFSACNVSKDIETPKPALPDTFRDAAVTIDTNSVGEIPWKSFYTDVTLQNLINSAIVKNFDMQIAIRNIEASQLLLKQVRWNYVPQAGVNIAASSTRSSDNSITKLSLSQNNVATQHIEDYSA